MSLKTTFLAAAIVSLALAGAVSAQSPELVFFGLDTSASMETNIAAIEEVTERQSPTFERLVTGRATAANASILLGSNSTNLDYLSATIDGAFGAEEIEKIAEFEATFGLDPSERSIGACSPVAAETCVAVFYACPEAAPRCHVTVTSSRIMGIEETRVSWFREATDIVSR